MNKLLLSVLFLVFCLHLHAQEIRDTTHICYLTMKDGSLVKGKLLSINDQEIKIRTINLGDLVITREKISQIDFADNNQKVQTANPSYSNRTRYFFGPSAFMLKQGEGYYQNSYIILHNVNFGITDNVSMGVGVETFSLIFGKPILLFTPKVGKKINDNIHLAAGAIAFVPVGWTDNLFSVGIGYAAATFGSEDLNLTTGLGWGATIGGDIGEHFSDPIATISGMAKLSKRIALITENWILTGQTSNALFSYGIRIMTSSASFDLGFINWNHNTLPVPIGIPYVDFVIHFGK